MGVRRGRHRNDQLHQRHDRPAERRAADASQHLVERHDVRLAARHQRSRRLSAHPPAVPLQRLGRALRGHRNGRQTRDHPQGRRRRDPAPDRSARRHRDVRRPGRRQRNSRRCGDVGRTDPRQWDRENGHRRSTTANSHHRTDRDRARLGVHPDLRAHRNDATADHEPPARRVRRPVAGRPGRQAQPSRSASTWCGVTHLARRRGSRPRQSHHGRVLESARCNCRRDSYRRG